MTGVLETAGGPSPGGHIPLAGTVDVTGSKGTYTTPTRPDGTFSLKVPSGLYNVTGHSARFGTGAQLCRATQLVHVLSGKSSVVAVLCQRR